VAVYSIKDLERLSGIKAHTLRIWEQRYGILNPERSDSNIRTYNDEDLKKVLNISILNNNGFKISKIANLGDLHIREKVLEVTETSPDSIIQIDSLVLAMVEMDEERFEKSLSYNILRQGFDNTVQDIVFPFLHKVGILWQTNSINPAQEHFISNLIRQKLIVAIDGANQKVAPNAQKVLLYLPDQELHEISLLFANYTLKSKGLKTIYLGQSVPHNNLNSVYLLHNPTYIVSVLTCPLPDQTIKDYVDQLSAEFPSSQILLSGFQVLSAELSLPQNVKTFADMQQLASFF
jgi:DNA-binding transcriptional MerR regulator